MAAIVESKQALLFLHLSLLLLASFKALAYDDAEENSYVTFAQPPHYFSTHPPVEAPKPHKGGGHHHHHHHHNHPLSPSPAKSPTQPPVKPPSHSAKPPTPPPAQPPTLPPSSHAPAVPRKLVAVQGVVYCKSCKFSGIDTLLGATPLVGATVRLQCNNTKYPLVQEDKTDKNGYFFIMPTKLTTAGIHKCRVFLISSPLSTCNTTTDLHAGVTGALLMPTPKSSVSKPGYQLFTVGPFAFEPSKKVHCK